MDVFTNEVILKCFTSKSFAPMKISSLGVNILPNDRQERNIYQKF